MPFDHQNSDYEKQYYSIFRKELVADRDNKILKENETKKRTSNRTIYFFVFATIFFLLIQMGIITPMTLMS